LYGALAGSDLLRYTALMMNRVLNTIGTPDDFLGKSEEETFVIISAPERAELIRKTVIDHFDTDAVQHYGLGERNGDKVKVRSTSGQELVLPMMKLETKVLK
jgi:hypothetical protein